MPPQCVTYPLSTTESKHPCKRGYEFEMDTETHAQINVLKARYLRLTEKEYQKESSPNQITKRVGRKYIKELCKWPPSRVQGIKD
jgi:hypothetical protein